MKKINWKELRTKKRFWIGAIIVLFIVVEGGIISNYFYKKYRLNQTAPRYQVTQLHPKTLLTVSGRVKAGTTQDLTPLSTGDYHITAVNYASGSYVSQGSEIGTITNQTAAGNARVLQTEISSMQSQITAQKAVVAAARTRLANAKKKRRPTYKVALNYARQKLAYLRGQKKILQSKLAVAQKRASQTLRAPYSGWLEITATSTGYSVKLIAQSQVVTGTVSEYDLATFKAAVKRVHVKAAATTTKSTATLTSLNVHQATVSSGVAQYRYVVALPSSSKFTVGQTVAVNLRHAGVAVAKSSLVQKKVKYTRRHHTYTRTVSYVYVVKKGVATRTHVTVVKYHGTNYITKGAKAGTTIVVHPKASLTRYHQKKVTAYE